MASVPELGEAGGEPTAEVEENASSSDNGQTGSIGMAECFTDDDCRAIEQGRLAELGFAGYPGAPFMVFECGLTSIIGVGTGPACKCGYEGGGALFVGLDCAQRGRHGECIYPASDFPGCELDQSGSCEAVCEDLSRRIEETSQLTYETELRSARCIQSNCTTISRVDDTCHINGNYREGYDCSATDEEILAQHAERVADSVPPPCDELDPNLGGTCTQAAPEPNYYPRDPNEWQGMLVDVSNPLYCEDFCGMALACIESQCLPCESDAQCLEGEGCALNHCAPLQNIACRGRADCADGSLCLLSGYTGGTARANEDMRAFCAGSGGASMNMPGQ